jgi:hypothetical protein
MIGAAIGLCAGIARNRELVHYRHG